jgi:hypothetical protein
MEMNTDTFLNLSRRSLTMHVKIGTRIRTETTFRLWQLKLSFMLVILITIILTADSDCLAPFQ